MAAPSMTPALRETLTIFDADGEPRTTPEVAEALDLGRRSTYARLDRLVEHDRLETKKVGANARVWWRPPTDAVRVAPEEDRTAFDSLVDAVEEYAIFTLDPQGYIQSWNPGAEQIKGYEAEAILGEHVSTFYTEDERADRIPERNLAEAARQGATEDEGWRLRNDGSRFWAKVTITAIRDARGDLQGYAKVTHDMTERKRAEGERELLYETTRTIAEAATLEEGLETALQTVCETTDWEYAETWLPTADGNLRRADDYYVADFEAFATYSADAIFDRDEGLPGRVLSSGEHEWVTNLSTRSRKEYPRLERAREAALRSWVGVPIVADDDVLAVFVFAMREAQEADERLIETVSSVAAELGSLVRRRRIEKQMKQERDLVEQIFETVPVGVGVLSRSREVVRANQRVDDILDIPDDDAFTVDELQLYDAQGDAVPVDEWPHAHVFDTGESVFWQCQLEPSSGERRWLSIIAAPLEGTEGEIDHLVFTVNDITRRKERSQRLERQRDELESELDEVFERIDDAFFALDDDWRFTYVNDQAADMVKLSVGELIGERAWDALPEIASGPQREAAERAMETQESFELEFHSELLDTWLEIRGYPSDSGLSVYVRDVTEQKHRETELQRYETTVETVWDGIATLDAENRFVMVNEAFCVMTGFDRAEVIGEPVSLIVDEPVLAGSEALGRAGATGDVDDGLRERDLQVADGGTIPVEAKFGPCEFADGTAGSTGVLRDVTERRERERELERYETVVETVNDGIYVVDGQSRFTMVNDAYAEMTGYSREDLLGAHVSLVVDDDTIETARAYEEKLRSGEREMARIEADLRTKDGDSIRAEAMFAPIDGTAGSSERVGVVRDVTARVEREQELERQREHLATLNNLNEIVRDITDAVIDQSTREEIEAIVCHRLADADSYQFAWIAEADMKTQAIRPRIEVGVDGYLQEISLSTCPDDPTGQGPAGRAVRTRDVQISRDVLTDPDFEPWREYARQYGYRSSAAIPIVHDDTLYGLLGVYADRPKAFAGEEREVITGLGEVVGHAIAAIERKQALMSDDVIEITFSVLDVLDSIGVDSGEGGTITFDRAVPIGDDVFLEYGTVDREAVDTLEALAEQHPDIEEVSIVDSDSPTIRYQLRASEPPIISVVASHGGYVQEARIEGGDLEMTVHLPTTVPASRIIDAVQQAYPNVNLLARRQIVRDDPSAQIHRATTEGLTDRQRTALEAAVYSGFFEWPRHASGEELADALGIASPTFHQHLRKAQKKVFESLYPNPAPV